MMKTTEEWKAITCRVPRSDWEEFNRIVEKRRMTQSDVLRMLFSVGLECHKDMERVGLIGVVDFLHYVKEAVKQKGTKRQLNLDF